MVSKALEDVRNFFGESDTAFTVHLVENSCVIGRIAYCFRSYKGKMNYIDINSIIRKEILNFQYCK